MTDCEMHAYYLSLWDQIVELRKSQATLKAQAQQMAQDQERIAALEAQVALMSQSALH
jgi:cell division protein FtsB